MLSNLIKKLDSVNSGIASISTLLKNPMFRWLVVDNVTRGISIDVEDMPYDLAKHLPESLEKLIVLKLESNSLFRFDRKNLNKLSTPLMGYNLIKHNGKYMLMVVGVRGTRLATIEIHCFGTSMAPIHDLLNDIINDEFRMPYISAPNSGAVKISQRYKGNTNLLPDGIYEQVDGMFSKFHTEKDYYIRNDLPYKETILLYGPPGTGKTSLVRHMAAKYNMDIVMANGPVKDLDVAHPTIILYEDIDRDPMFLEPKDVEEEDVYAPAPTRDELLGPDLPSFGAITAQPQPIPVQVHDHALERPARRVPSGRFSPDGGFNSTMRTRGLSAMLNFLDGPVPLDNVIVVMTANNPELLAHALTREGRVDASIHVNYLTKEEFINHVGRGADDPIVVHFLEKYGDRPINAGLTNIVKRCETIETLDKRMAQQLIREAERKY